MPPPNILAVIGAGPKAVALAAKRAILADCDFEVPELLVFDSNGVAAAWTGDHGFTDGKQLLGTPPEKDVGFPYHSFCWKRGPQDLNNDVNARMLKFSWQHYLLHHPRGRFANQVDRGHPPPTHRQWGNYLQDVWIRTGVQLIQERVTEIGLKGGQWSLRSASGERVVDGLIITGTGPARRLPGQPEHGRRVFDGRDFWLNENIRTIRPQAGAGRRRTARRPLPIGVVGGGETAAAIVCAILDRFGERTIVQLIGGPVYSRGEGFHENRVFTDPEADRWSELPLDHRQEFIKRTDRGVFSHNAVGKLRNSADNFVWTAGKVVEIHHEENRVIAVLEEYGGGSNVWVPYDYLIVATGFNSLWFRSEGPGTTLEAQRGLRMTVEAQRALDDAVGVNFVEEDPRPYRTALEAGIEYDLSVRGLKPKLHLPMLSGVSQGPGFPNLSCLGRFSDRILLPYTDADMREGLGGRLLRDPLPNEP